MGTKRRSIKVFLIIFGIILVCLLSLFMWQKSSIDAIINASQYSSDQLATMETENSRKLAEDVGKYFGGELRDYTDDERNQLNSGAITENDLIIKIINEKAGNDNNSAESVVSKYVGQLNAMQGEYNGILNGLAAQAIAEYIALPNAEHTLPNKISIGNKYVSIGRSYEGECDAKVNSLLASLASELKAINADTSIVNNLRSSYYSQKKIKMSQMMSKYRR